MRIIENRDPELDQPIRTVLETRIQEPTQTQAVAVPIAQVVWTEHWDNLGTTFEEVATAPTWFWNLEEDTYNNLTINTEDKSMMRYALTVPVIGRALRDRVP